MDTFIPYMYIQDQEREGVSLSLALTRGAFSDFLERGVDFVFDPEGEGSQ